MSILHGYQLGSAMLGLSPKNHSRPSLAIKTAQDPRKRTEATTRTDFHIRQILLYMDGHFSSPLDYTVRENNLPYHTFKVLGGYKPRCSVLDQK